jgi:hypothetical protein
VNGWKPLANRILLCAIFLFFVWAIGYAADAEAHLAYKRAQNATLRQQERTQERNLAHARYVANNGAQANQRWHRIAVRWLAEELLETRRALRPPVTDWAAIQMRYGDRLAADSVGDPWPSCPDPHDGSGASWYDTVKCENNGSWLDSPGYYRCGLQFDPMWERVYGRRFCP